MAYNPDRLHTIEINWGFPVPLETFDNNWKSVEIGIFLEYSVVKKLLSI